MLLMPGYGSRVHMQGINARSSRRWVTAAHLLCQRKAPVINLILRRIRYQPLKFDSRHPGASNNRRWH